MIIPGKIPFIKKAKLTIACSAGTMIDQQQWIPADNHSYFDSKYPVVYQDLNVQIELDHLTIFAGSLEKNIMVEHWFDDSESVTDHYVKISLSGLKHSHRVFLDGLGEVAPMMKVDGVWIEDLSMRRVLEDHGQCFYEDESVSHVPSEYMGQNGFQLLKFSTPVYPWLLTMHKTPDYFF